MGNEGFKELTADDFYTDEVVKIILQFKSKLPDGLKFDTDIVEYEGHGWIKILPPPSYLRNTNIPAEDRLRVAATFEEMQQAIRRTGVGCEIELL